MKKYKLALTMAGTTAALALLFLTFAPYATGDDSPDRFGPRGHGLFGGHGESHDLSRMIDHILQRLDEELDLSDGQVADLRALLDEHRLANEPRWQEMQTATHDVHHAMTAEAFDETALREAVREAAAVTEELVVSHGQLMSEARTILTPEQIEALKAMHGDRFPAGRLMGAHRMMRWMHGGGR